MASPIRSGELGLLHPLPNLNHLFSRYYGQAGVLHNANEIARLDLHIGDYVFVEKGAKSFRK